MDDKINNEKNSQEETKKPEKKVSWSNPKTRTIQEGNMTVHRNTGEETPVL